jgi:hypothetical protein
MPRTHLNAKDHAKLVANCGGTFVGTGLYEAIVQYKGEMGNVGVALKVAAIQSYYRS